MSTELAEIRNLFAEINSLFSGRDNAMCGSVLSTCLYKLFCDEYSRKKNPDVRKYFKEFMDNLLKDFDNFVQDYNKENNNESH